MTEKKTLSTGIILLRTVFKSIVLTSAIVGMICLELFSGEFIRLPIVVNVVAFVSLVLTVFWLSFMFFFDRYLIKHRPPDFYEKAGLYDETE